MRCVYDFSVDRGERAVSAFYIHFPQQKRETMPDQCPSCKQYSLDVDQLECESQVVCTECGYVDQARTAAVACDERADAAAVFVGAAHQTGSRIFSTSTPIAYRQGKSDAKGKKKGVEEIRCLSKTLGLNSVDSERAISLFQKAYVHENFKRMYMEGKLLLAGSCVYTVCRENNMPISVKYFSEIMKCNEYKLASMKTRLHTFLNISLPGVDAWELVPGICNKAGLAHLSNDTAKCVELFRSTSWLSCGRKPVLIVTICMFLVWKALDYPKHKKVTLKEYCKSNNLFFSAVYKLRLDEAISFLKTLCLKIPWVSSVNDHNVCVYIKDIFQYQNSLVSDCLQKPSSGSEVNQTEQKSEIHVHINQEASESNESIPEVFLPRAFVVGKSKWDEEESESIKTPNSLSQYDHDLDSCEVTEQDMSTSELSTYIRDENEVRTHIALKKKYEFASDGEG